MTRDDRTSTPPLTAFAVVWRVLLGVAAVAVAVPLAAALAFGALVTWDGCFIECRTYRPAHGRAALLAVTAVVTLIVPGAVMAVLWRRRLLAFVVTTGAVLALGSLAATVVGVG